MTWIKTCCHKTLGDFSSDNCFPMENLTCPPSSTQIYLSLLYPKQPHLTTLRVNLFLSLKCELSRKRKLLFPLEFPAYCLT